MEKYKMLFERVGFNKNQAFFLNGVILGISVTGILLIYLKGV